MADPSSSFLSTKRYAVVTGANKGIGLEICRQLASKGVVVVLTARDQKRGVEALENLKSKQISLSGFLEFHQLDVTDPCSIASLADFVKSKFGKLDILVNNAGILGSRMDSDIFRALARKKQINCGETEKYELGEECVKTNYYGAKRVTETLLPLLQLSDSPRIVNVSSGWGMLKHIPNESIREILDDIENLTEEKIDRILNEFLEDLKKDELLVKGWPPHFSAYMLSKAAMNAYTRIMAKKHLDVDINCVCPGYVKTDINFNTGTISIEEGSEHPIRLALLPKGEASGIFFTEKDPSLF